MTWIRKILICFTIISALCFSYIFITGYNKSVDGPILNHDGKCVTAAGGKGKFSPEGICIQK